MLSSLSSPSRSLSPHNPLSLPRSMSPDAAPITLKPDDARDKKPRVRHSEIQLAALNDLYEANEHPSLEDRAALAENLGMEPKAVNAWFANKRSATKKKIRGSIHPYSTPPPHSHVDDFDDVSPAHSRLSTPLSSMDYQTFPTMDSDNRHVFDSEISTGIPRRMRIRPTPKQTDELRRLYNRNTHPSKDDREALGLRIGMKYQSVTNWFQNQRSLARKRLEEQDLDAHSAQSTDHNDYSSIDSLSELQTLSSFPPAASHPCLGSSMTSQSPASRSVSVSHTPICDNPKVASLRRMNGGPMSRPRRTRPEPYQLEALKKLFSRTSNPSIEERGALALEIGMDVGKVTNWFRNLRQTARKRAQKSNNDDGDDEGMDYDDSAPVSRDGTPLLTSTTSSYSSSSMDDDVEGMDLDGEHYYGNAHHHHSDGGSEEEDQEAVTPPPAPSRVTGRRRMDVGFLTGSSDDLHLPPPPSKSLIGSSSGPSIAPPRVEDALLLLGFSQHVVHW
ncbi:hypothetical protein EW145_g962 [Phellinidium pouzarii]|uniref:Homeobox domain-containing protein n=1 Tax=Phellinidium pouzarii TaxID=167371 RepID=A0A4S4LG97_9AGAM|nr:hypothetical protein EW145_g962 [Phellinidium pouzarii]